MSKAERLAIASAAAPVLRTLPEKTARRRVFVTGKDGEVVRVATGAEVVKGLAEAFEIEHAVNGGRGEERLCVACGRPFRARRDGGFARKACGACPCELCESTVDGNLANRQSAKGFVPRCRTCARLRQKEAARKAQAAVTPERRRKAALMGHAKRKSAATARKAKKGSP
jgi:hypothetical protein